MKIILFCAAITYMYFSFANKLYPTKIHGEFSEAHRIKLSICKTENIDELGVLYMHTVTFVDLVYTNIRSQIADSVW